MECINIQKTLGRTDRMLETKQELDQFRQSFRRIEAALCRLQADTSLNSWRLCDQLAMDSKLRKMLPVMDALHDSTHSNLVKRHAYYPDTRSSFESVYGWAHGLGTESICWMNGMAGTGKTSIAYNLCAELERNGRLGASLFCSHSCSESVDVARIFPTVAYQLAQLSRPFRWTLCKALESISDYGKQDLGDQFEALIVAPFLEVRDLLPSGLVVVIDTLDECLDVETANLVLDILLSQSNNLPIRFLITSHADNPVSRIASSQNDGNLLVISPNTDSEDQVRINGLLQSCSSDALEDKQATEYNFSAGFRLFHGLRDYDGRYNLQFNELYDLEKAITYESRALALTPDNHPDLPRRLADLGVAHGNRFERLSDLDDLEKAIEYNSRASDLTPDSHPDLPIRLSNLGAYFSHRFQRLGDLSDLGKAIEYQSRALALTPDGHPNLSRWLAYLGSSYNHRFQRLGDMGDLEKAIECHSCALELTSDDPPDLCRKHFNLALSHVQYYEHTNEPSHLQDSLDSFRIASKSLVGAPRYKFHHACGWARHASKHSTLDSIEAYQTIVDLLPQFIWLGATTNQRYQDLSTAGTLAVDAAAAAIVSANYALALEWLEHARCIVWNQSLMLRSPLDQLHSFHPALATRLQAVATQLHDAGSGSRESRVLSSSSMTEEQAAQEHHRLAKEYDELLTHARTLPGFEDFLRPMKVDQLVPAARNGPIVVINCSKSRCDALVILPEQGDVNHIPLPNFSEDKAQRARSEIEASIEGHRLRERGVQRRPAVENDQSNEFGSVLADLWNDVVKPVLDFLGYTNHVSCDDLPHITWCPTGVMSFLPLHAAGDYDRPRSRVFDYVMSSYTPTLAALLESTPYLLSRDSRILAIGQAATPGHAPLTGTTKELAYVKAQTQGKAEYSQLIDDRATTTAVLDAMGKHDWVHLACHAHQNVADATQSGFFLHDGVLDLASINRRSFKGKGLAFLSACQTATGDEQLPDEAVHLASGMLMAGYKSVIATMWSVDDSDAPLVADKVYSQLMIYSKLGNGEAGNALHNAVAELRDKVGEKEFGRWVPYIHIGS
ncbi:hypothetical protein ACGC1H_002545 [Rhizoctonia solani]